MNNTDKPNSEKKMVFGSYWDFLYSTLLPKIGRLLLFFTVFAPASVISLLYVSLFPDEKTESIDIYAVITVTITISCMIVSTWWWLNYLEKKVNFPILLPVPLINVPLKWVIYPFMLPFFGIQWLFKRLNSK